MKQEDLNGTRVSWNECVVLCRSAFRICLIVGYWLFTAIYMPLSSLTVEGSCLAKGHVPFPGQPASNDWSTQSTKACLAPLPKLDIPVSLKDLLIFWILSGISWVLQTQFHPSSNLTPAQTAWFPLLLYRSHSREPSPIKPLWIHVRVSESVS